MDNVFLALRVVVSLGVVIGAIWFVQRRVSRSGGKKASNKKPVSVIARQNLGAKASVAVVEFAGKRFLLGVTEHGISVLDNGAMVPDAVVAEIEPAPLAEIQAPVAAATKPVRRKAAAREFGDALGEAQTVAASSAAPRVQLVDDDVSNSEVQAALTPASSRLAGSILSASTWKQAYLAIRGGR